MTAFADFRFSLKSRKVRCWMEDAATTPALLRAIVLARKPQWVHLLLDILEGHGFSAQGFSDPNAALDSLLRSAPQLVVVTAGPGEVEAAARFASVLRMMGGAQSSRLLLLAGENAFVPDEDAFDEVVRGSLARESGRLALDTRVRQLLSARKISGTRLRRVSERLLAAAEEPAPQEEVEQGEQ